MGNELGKVHKQSFYNRELVLQSEACGCFFCLAVFRPADVRVWADGGKTALCPYCQVDSVIASAGDYPLTDALLVQMRNRYFDKHQSG